MKKYVYLCVCVLLMSIPCRLCADNDAHQIPLVEIPSSDDDWGRDDPGPGGSQTDPNQYSAIINGHVLSVAVVDPPQQPNLRVYKADGSLVVNRRFTRTINVHLSDTGYYTLVITIGFQSFQGQFEIVD